MQRATALRWFVPLRLLCGAAADITGILAHNVMAMRRHL
jgi:hypothetical protein